MSRSAAETEVVLPSRKREDFVAFSLIVPNGAYSEPPWMMLSATTESALAADSGAPGEVPFCMKRMVLSVPPLALSVKLVEVEP